MVVDYADCVRNLIVFRCHRGFQLVCHHQDLLCFVKLITHRITGFVYSSNIFNFKKSNWPLSEFVKNSVEIKKLASYFLENPFLVGAFYQNEPDYYSGKFFFVRQQNVCVVDTFYRTKLLGRQAETHLSWCKGSPFVHSIFNERYKTGREYRVPPLNFFRHCSAFFRIFLSPKGPPSNFLIFCNKLDFQKVEIPFTISKTLRFLSLRYSADFRRSLLVHVMICVQYFPVTF